MTHERESKTERSTMAVTPREKHRIRFVCGADNETESDLLRRLVLPYVNKRHAEITEKLGNDPNSAVKAAA